MKQIIHTDAAPAAIGPYTQGNRAGNTVYLSGQLGIDPSTGKLAEGGVSGQARQALKNIQALLTSLNATEHNVVKTTVFLTSMADFKEVNEAYSAVFSSDCPARSCVAVKELPLNGLVEIEAIVAL
ncbi:MAG: Rid family detoxifying hydrolase [Desulfovibrionaceae bacterium]|nr:Rid family detoxifying hydrolase [Desulfovibrionaceae bacterium]